jgi:hypothetical protein
MAMIDRFELDDARDGGEAAEQRHIRHRPADVLAAEVGGGHGA